jgi:hypothetical protein
VFLVLNCSILCVWFKLFNCVSALYEVVSECSWTIIVVTAPVKEDERGGQGHTSASLFHQSAMCRYAVNTHCFYTSGFLA